MFHTKVVRKIKTHIFVFSNSFFPRKSCGCEILWKNTVERGRPQMTIWGACALHAGYLWVQKHTLKFCNTAFAQRRMVARTRLNVTLCVNCLSCLFSLQRKSFFFLPIHRRSGVNATPFCTTIYHKL